MMVKWKNINWETETEDDINETGRKLKRMGGMAGKMKKVKQNGTENERWFNKNVPEPIRHLLLYHSSTKGCTKNSETSGLG
jgi:hypothetical protein